MFDAVAKRDSISPLKKPQIVQVMNHVDKNGATAYPASPEALSKLVFTFTELSAHHDSHGVAQLA